MQEAEQTPEEVFGARVLQQRDGIGLTQATLAVQLTMKGLKIDPSAVARLEKGKRSIRLNEAVTLADCFGMTVDEMLRPSLPPAEQIAQAEQALERARWREAEARAELHVAAERLRQLHALENGGGDDDGERGEAT